MIIPIGHEESEVRRWPWASFAIMAICVLALLVTDGDANDPRWQENAVTLEDAIAFWREHPYLDASPELRAEVGHDVPPDQRQAPDDPERLAAEQTRLDELTAEALEAGAGLPAEHPYRKWGFTPDEPSPGTLLTHMFMHAGWIHLLSNLFLFFLAGPALEDRWGRPLFGAFFVAAGLASGLFFALMTQDGSAPLLGASGAIAGVLGAFLVRFHRSEIRFAYFFLLGFRALRGTFEAPAWAMLPLWFANELFSAWLVGAVGRSDGVAYWAHVGGFLFGVGGALAVRGAKLEERFIQTAIEAKVTLARGNAVVDEAARLRSGADLEGAFALLEAESRRRPEDLDVAVAFWDTAVALQRPEAAAAGFAKAIRRLSAGDGLGAALGYWTELTGLVPGALVDPATLMRFVPVLRGEARHAEASRALRDAVDPANRGLTPAQAARLVELARESDPVVAATAARRALESSELAGQVRARLEQQLGALEEAAAALPAAEPRTAAEPAPADRSIAIDLEPEPEGVLADPGTVAGDAFHSRWSDVKLTEVTPTRLDDTALALALPGGGKARLELAKIQAIAVGIVGGLAAKPVILIDLLLNYSQLDESTLRLVRLRSDRFDPRRLAAGATPLEAFRAFLHALAEHASATLLPDPESFRGGAFARFADLESWQREVLQIG